MAVRLPALAGELPVGGNGVTGVEVGELLGFPCPGPPFESAWDFVPDERVCDAARMWDPVECNAECDVECGIARWLAFWDCGTLWRL
ncbi:dd0bc11d-48c8-48b0-bd25-d3dd04bea45b [Thermothielavioides terrestris]|uniref:Dd0bc11d-48c8-48b0-bd25-d3dd04bea45b n=1 Tax=Thermothielavioides terrestris TaxID=2587410 RepID=A0A446BY84_9PEZI|nr:dd0bc11d-48c8-48b0-bd25-d3dd04bea45b [Thermothielavioides terrestris]